MAIRPEDVGDSTLRLVLARGIGPATLRRLRDHFGDDDRIVAATRRELEGVHGIAGRTADAIRRAIEDTDPDRERQAMHERDARLVLIDDPSYPALLATIPDPPTALWMRGELKATDAMAIGIVGSRRCTSYGREQAGRFAAMLGQYGYTIVSGGAVGIDGEAHRGAMRSDGRTVAIMGCGLSRSYPPDHHDLFEQIVARGGALVSELPMAAEPRPEHFPRRNRIISGMSVGVVVVEAAQRSGALITARLAADEHGREVMAIPGRVDSPASAGCLRAIREGWAALVSSPSDVLQQLETAGHLVRGALAAGGVEPNAAEQDASAEAAPGDGVRSRIIDVLQDAGRAVAVDELARRCGLPMRALLAELTMLEMSGRLQRDHRGFELRRRAER